MESIRRDRVEKEIKQLTKRETSRKTFRKIGRLLSPAQNKGLSRIDTLDARATNVSFGNPNDPKTWKGPWISVTNLSEIAQTVAEINSQQYHQAHNTPFGSGLVDSMVGRQGDTSTANKLIQGNLPTTPPCYPMPEVERIINTLARQYPTTPGTSVLTDKEFISTYKKAHKSTTLSPSGRHIGHYKAILKDPMLVTMHTDMMSLPFQVGFAPE
jgi:hypothetical protein